MGTQTEQQFIVHLDIHASALDPSDAVQKAVEEVVLGELRNCTFSVEKVGSAAPSSSAARHDVDFGRTVSRVRGGTSRRDCSRYHGEYLG
jgi:hypothetical protein